MKRDFKFRHVDEIAGTFVICALALLVLGVVLAGRAQGWFEGTFSLNVVFETAEGSFGLQEGAAVQVRSTVAGRVGKIMPTEGGLMGTTLILKERFHPFVTQDSVAKVKKKFGVAGDAYVEVERGKGPIVEDGGTIACVKDEELMETAQKMLAELEESLLPMFEEFKNIVASAASILASVEQGEGLAGAIVTDPVLRDDFRGIVAHLEGVVLEAEHAVAQANALLSNDVSEIAGDITVVADRAKVLMRDDITRIAANMHGIQSELTRTLEESRRLIVGIQRHWLFRKHVKQDSDTVPLVPASLSELGDPDLMRTLQSALDEARAADHSSAIAKHAYNLGVCRLASGDPVSAGRLNTEARIACRSAGGSAASSYLLEAELCRRESKLDEAVALVEKALESPPDGDAARATNAEAYILLGTIQFDAENMAGAARALDRASRLNKRLEHPAYAAAVCGLRGRIALHQGSQKIAAEAFQEQAKWLRRAGTLGSMASTLLQAGNVYSGMGEHGEAAELYCRAASSLIAQGHLPRAAEVLALATPASEAAGDELLSARIQQLQLNVE
ncbi:MAG: hypothetical protein HN341_17545 [Verrucomicrobia bacterium]|jgi:phospholipid/cholesterol/gamma-HCH transport system substrate-binding protein|nr:hypothetical protein [Verrucomicrobiota bacterium]MBT7065708.1 hypothetical protein [Verrucomicrobiota bacterium]